VHESIQKSGDASQSDAVALRTAILVIGFILFIPGLVYLAIALAEILSGSGYRTEDHYSIALVGGVFGAIHGAALVVVGYLLLRIARRKFVYSVREMLYPALIVAGAYMVVQAALGFVHPIVVFYVLIEEIHWSMALTLPFSLPYFVGGLLLVMIGLHRYPSRVRS